MSLNWLWKLLKALDALVRITFQSQRHTKLFISVAAHRNCVKSRLQFFQSALSDSNRVRLSRVNFILLRVEHCLLNTTKYMIKGIVPPNCKKHFFTILSFQTCITSFFSVRNSYFWRMLVTMLTMLNPTDLYEQKITKTFLKISPLVFHRRKSLVQVLNVRFECFWRWINDDGILFWGELSF